MDTLCNVLTLGARAREREVYSRCPCLREREVRGLLHLESLSSEYHGLVPRKSRAKQELVTALSAPVGEVHATVAKSHTHLCLPVEAGRDVLKAHETGYQHRQIIVP
jgi:hypothetical protein